MAERFRRLIAAISGAGRPAHCIGGGLYENRFVRFLIAGAVNTLFGFVVYSFLIIAGSAVWSALLMGMLSGTVFNFFTTGGYAFRDLSLARFPRFLLCYLLVYGINFVLLELLATWLNNKIIAQAIVTVPMALLSYFIMVRFVFSKKYSGSQDNTVI